MLGEPSGPGGGGGGVYTGTKPCSQLESHHFQLPQMEWLPPAQREISMLVVGIRITSYRGSNFHLLREPLRDGRKLCSPVPD